MRTTLLGLMLLALAIPARAQDVVHLAWGDAPSRGGASTLAFDCNVNAGSNTIVVTLTPQHDIQNVTYLRTSLRIVMGEDATCCFGYCYPPPLDPWWKCEPGAPRAGAIRASADFELEPWSESTTVEDPWAGCMSGSMPYQVETTISPYGAPGDTSEVGALNLEIVPPTNARVELLAGHEYYVGRFTVMDSHTFGAGSVGHCCAPAKLFAIVSLSSDQTTQGDIDAIGMPITWNGWRAGACDAALPVRAKTWGALKSAYR